MALTLTAMEYFVVAQRHGNIVKAAADLNIAASSIATAIPQVEAEFDLRLVARQRNTGYRRLPRNHWSAEPPRRCIISRRPFPTRGAAATGCGLCQFDRDGAQPCGVRTGLRNPEHTAFDRQNLLRSACGGTPYRSYLAPACAGDKL